MLPLNSAEFLVSLLRKLALHPNHRLETRVEKGHAEVQQLRDFGDKLLVQHIEDLLRIVMLLLSSWEFGGIVTGLSDEFVDLASCSIIVK